MTITQLESMEVTVPATLVAQVDKATAPAEIAAAIGEAFGTLCPAMERAGLAANGPPRVIYTGWGPDEVRFTLAIPVAGKPIESRDAKGIRIDELPARVALRFVHHGPYRDIRSTYDQIEAWLRERGGIKTPADWARYSPMWEEYLNDPATTPESELLTHIFLPLPEA